MSIAKLIVMYPQPADRAAFEKVYAEEHVPLAVKNLVGKTKIIATKVLSAPQGIPRFYRIVEVHFPSMAVLASCADSQGGKETLDHAVQISSGGPPVIMVAEEEAFTF